MSSEHGFDDPLGFSRETAALITGLGCTNLKQFRKRNISLDDLAYLTREDLRILDVGDDFDYKAFDKLAATLRKKRPTRTNPKMADVLNIMQNNQKQMRLLYLYLKVVSTQLKTIKTDEIIDQQKNIKASEGIMIGCKSILAECESFQEELDKLLPGNTKSNSSKKAKSVLVGVGLGVGISFVIIYYKYIR